MKSRIPKVKKAYEYLGTFFFITYIFLFQLVDETIIDRINDYSTTLFIVVSVFIGFVVVKDVMLRWNRRQQKFEAMVNKEIKESIEREMQSNEYEDKIDECNLRLERYNELVNMTSNQYLSSLLWTFLFLTASVITHIFFSTQTTLLGTTISGPQLTFTLFWIGLYHLIKHFILILFIVEQT